jgi:elongation factor Ts
MGKCRQALAEESGDIEKAVDWLRRRGIRSMERRTNEAAESMLAICTHAGGAGSIVELCAETDFVTQNALFQELAISVACTHAARGAGGQGSELGEVLLAASTPELSAKLSSGASVQAALLELGSVLGERLVLGQSRLLEASPSSGGVVAGYAHPKHVGAVAGTGRMAALVSLRPSPNNAEVVDALTQIASQMARHIVASQPLFVSVDSIGPDVLEKERSTMKDAYMEELDEKRRKNLNEAVLAKVLDGKTKKFYEESVLLRQELTIPSADEADGKPMSVEKWLKSEAKSIGLEDITVEDFHLVCL